MTMISSALIGNLMYKRIRAIEESPCAHLASTRSSTKAVVDHMWSILHAVEATPETDAAALTSALAIRGSTADEWAERTACGEAFSVIKAAAHA